MELHNITDNYAEYMFFTNIFINDDDDDDDEDDDEEDEQMTMSISQILFVVMAMIHVYESLMVDEDGNLLCDLGSIFLAICCILLAIVYQGGL